MVGGGSSLDEKMPVNRLDSTPLGMPISQSLDDN